MGIRIGWWTVDVDDAQTLASFWQELLGWERLFDDPDEGIALVPSLPPVIGQGMLLYTHHESGPKQVKNRAHPDLRPVDQAATVLRALDLGGSRADIGQDDASWEVLADPAGNEFCVLADLPVEGGPEVRIDAWTLDANDVPAAAAFWQELLGWDDADRDSESVRLRDPSGVSDDLLILHTPDHKMVKNRVHPDLIPDGEPGDEESRQREIQRVLDLGGWHADIGQGDVGWSVMADPDGNEFCILKPPPADGP